MGTSRVGVQSLKGGAKMSGGFDHLSSSLPPPILLVIKLTVVELRQPMQGAVHIITFASPYGSLSQLQLTLA